MKESLFKVEDTANRLVYFLEMHGVTLYTRIDQQAELKKNGSTIRPLELIIFGNPQVGGPVIIENPLAALDLPLKILIGEDTFDKTWLAYQDMRYFAKRYSLEEKLIAPLNLDSIVNEALKF